MASMLSAAFIVDAAARCDWCTPIDILPGLRARNQRVFGSVARGQADAASDVDFLVEMEPGRSLFNLGGLQYELEQLLGCPVDVVTERGLKARIRDRGLREAVLL